MRMTRTLTEDLVRTLIDARPDWPSTTIWATISGLHRAGDHSYPEVFIAAMHCAANPLISDPSVIAMEGPHWDNLPAYLSTGQHGRRFRSVQAQQVIEQARVDQTRRRPGVSHRDLYLAALDRKRTEQAS